MGISWPKWNLLPSNENAIEIGNKRRMNYINSSWYMDYPSSLFYDLKLLTILGPFTLFAPTDAAFAKISSEIMTKLSHDKDLLAKVIKYHVAAGKQLMSSFSNDIEIGSWENGYRIRINRYHNGQVRNLPLNMTKGFMWTSINIYKDTVFSLKLKNAQFEHKVYKNLFFLITRVYCVLS